MRRCGGPRPRGAVPGLRPGPSRPVPGRCGLAGAGRIATSMVIVSDLLDAALPGRQEVIGFAPNLAARLQSEAEPDSVVVADATFRLTRGSLSSSPSASDP